MEGDNLTEEVAINFITPHAADLQVFSSLNLDAETANVLRQDIIIASKMSEIEAYFGEGKVDIAAAYAAGDADGRGVRHRARGARGDRSRRAAAASACPRS